MGASEKFAKPIVLLAAAAVVLIAVAKGKGSIGLSLEFLIRKTLPPNWGEHQEAMETLSR